jgi:hypothetical protein
LSALRSLLVGAIVLATVGFVIGTSIERHNSRHESATQRAAETRSTEGATTGETAPAEGGETPEQHAAEGAGTPHTETHRELRPLGIDIEAVPFVVLAALTSVALAALGWSRPRWLAGLVAIAVAMTVFAVLDVREVFHQSDENQAGLEVLAAVIAALHLAAAAAAVALAMAARRNPPPTPPAATMAA